MFVSDNNFSINSNLEGNNNIIENEMNIDIDMMNNSQYDMSGSSMCPITEPLKERCVHRTIVHDVPHICPIRTKVINHHVYRHTYRPEYSCCEENTVSNVQCGSCCDFQ